MKKNKKQNSIRLWAVFAWLVVWQLASMAINQQIILVSPVKVIVRLIELLPTADFWFSVAFSFLRIVTGFLLAVILASALAALSARFRLLGDFFAPLMLTMKTIPVASFVILAIILVGTKNLSALMSFIMVFPIVYANVYEGIRSTDKNLLEMAAVFRVPAHKKIAYIYVPQVLPHFRSACVISLGICWKSGIAAEVIGISKGSIGEKLYNAKVYFNTPDLFAWTLTIIVISLCFEKLFLFLLARFEKRLERM